jgi:hypothetical protein
LPPVQTHSTTTPNHQTPDISIKTISPVTTTHGSAQTQLHHQARIGKPKFTESNPSHAEHTQAQIGAETVNPSHAEHTQA